MWGQQDSLADSHFQCGILSPLPSRSIQYHTRAASEIHLPQIVWYCDAPVHFRPFWTKFSFKGKMTFSKALWQPYFPHQTTFPDYTSFKRHTVTPTEKRKMTYTLNAKYLFPMVMPKSNKYTRIVENISAEILRAHML